MINFEEIKRNHKRSVARLANFLAYNVSKSDVEAIVEETTFDAMKARPVESYGKFLLKAKEKASGVFFRQGTVGSWRDIMSSNQVMQINEMINEKYLPVDLDFYEMRWWICFLYL